MVKTLTQNWWLVVLRGVLSILFGIAAFIWPSDALAALVIVFGAYAFVDGISSVATGIIGAGASGGMRWFLVLGGLAGIIVGVVTFFYPGITALGLLYFISTWAIITGVFEVVAAIQLRQEITNEWSLIFGGVLSVLFGVLIAIFPQSGALSVLWLIGLYAVIYGVAIVALGFRVKGLNTTLTNLSSNTM